MDAKEKQTEVIEAIVSVLYDRFKRIQDKENAPLRMIRYWFILRRIRKARLG